MVLILCYVIGLLAWGNCLVDLYRLGLKALFTINLTLAIWWAIGYPIIAWLA